MTLICGMISVQEKLWYCTSTTSSEEFIKKGCVCHFYQNCILGQNISAARMKYEGETSHHPDQSFPCFMQPAFVFFGHLKYETCLENMSPISFLAFWIFPHFSKKYVCKLCQS